MSKQSNVDRIWDIIENAGVCMLATQRAGRLRARPMEVRPDRKRRLIFAVTDAHSAKLDEIEARPDIGLIFIDAKAKAYLAAAGYVEEEFFFEGTARAFSTGRVEPADAIPVAMPLRSSPSIASSAMFRQAAEGAV